MHISIDTIHQISCLNFTLISIKQTSIVSIFKTLFVIKVKQNYQDETFRFIEKGSTFDFIYKHVFLHTKQCSIALYVTTKVQTKH